MGKVWKYKKGLVCSNWGGIVKSLAPRRSYACGMFACAEERTCKVKECDGLSRKCFAGSGV